MIFELREKFETPSEDIWQKSHQCCPDQELRDVIDKVLWYQPISVILVHFLDPPRVNQVCLLCEHVGHLTTNITILCPSMQFYKIKLNVNCYVLDILCALHRLNDTFQFKATKECLQLES